MDLTFTDEQLMLRKTVRELCEEHSPPEVVRALEDDPAGYARELWDQMGTLGLTGLTIPEEHGGVGGSALDLVLVYEELGRALAPTPHFASCVLAAAALRIAGAVEQLPSIASGEAIATPAWFEPGGGDGPEGIQAPEAGGRITGTKILVPFASSAQRLVVLARAPDGIGVFLVDTAGEGVSLEQEKTMASDAQYRVVLEGAPSERIGGDGWAIWNEAMLDGLIALAAYAVGGAERAHEMAVAYAKERIQFGKPIGAFQGVAHPLADIATEIGGARVLTYEAAWARASGRDASTLAAMAKLYACDVFKRATKVGQQVFGGIGFTLDIDMQLYFRRAKQMEPLWWGPRYLEERIAAAELDAAKPFVGIDAGLE